MLSLVFSCNDKEPINTDVINKDTADVDTTFYDTICNYRGLTIDTIILELIDEEKLIGQWELISYIERENCNIQTIPDDLDDSVVLEFLSIDSLKGNTIVNSFQGNYRINNQKIEFYNFIITEMCCDPTWATDFSTAIYYTDYLTIQHDTLAIFYNQSKNAMVFIKSN